MAYDNEGERIKRRRKEISLTQSELAERLGYTSKAAISRIERGENNFPLNNIEAWEKLCIPPAITFSANPT
ncbi:helix-turn-helix domain-containing protein [Allobaculum sp. Allo2]|uniref:helix-turn-helix domain-containing protein n=1 Tax=Allobaculum sp. Allo2 TaxID=2853432 RepID=UPI0034631BAF|nr:helix-turn-helix domain-containing protein [Allobaculum sp. Allo2]